MVDYFDTQLSSVYHLEYIVVICLSILDIVYIIRTIHLWCIVQPYTEVVYAEIRDDCSLKRAFTKDTFKMVIHQYQGAVSLLTCASLWGRRRIPLLCCSCSSGSSLTITDGGH